MTFDSIEIIQLIILGNSILLGLLFFSIPSKNKEANVYLGLFLLCIGLSIYNDIFGGIIIENYTDEVFIVIEPFLFQLIFLIFYQFKAIYLKIKKWYYLAFIPGIIHNAILNLNFISQSEINLSVYEYSVYFFEVLLLLLTFNNFRHHRNNIKKYYSEIENKSLLWLKELYILIISFHFLSIFSEVLDLIGFNTSIFENIIYVSFLGIGLTIPFWIGYYGFTQTGIFNDYLFKRINSDENSFNDSEISKNDIKKFRTIRNHILKQEIYTNPNLNLRYLSDIMNISENELSRLINKCGNVNFYLFINQLRIKKFKELIQSHKIQKLSILGIAMESGFSSKSTFYKTFKSIEGVTPREFLDSQNKS